MKKYSSVKIWIRSAIIAAVCFIGVYILYLTGVFNYLENKTYDNRMITTSSHFRASDDIVFITIDQESVDWAKENLGWGWTWPREGIADIIDFLSAGNVNSIGFDIVYTEPSIYGEEDDLRLAEAERKSGKVIQIMFVDDSSGKQKVLYPIECIKENAELIANVTSCFDSDKVIRSSRVYFEYEGQKIPSLGFAPIVMEGTDIEDIPCYEDGTVLLRFQKSTDNYNPYRASDILKSYYAWKNGEESDYIPEDFEGAYCFIGVYGPGFFDLCSTSVSQVYPGVGVHITALDNYLNNNFIKKIPAFLIFIWILLLAIYGSVLVAFSETQKTGRLTVLYLSLGLIFGLFLSTGIPYILFFYNIWLQLIAPFISFLSSYIISLALNYIIEGKQKRFIKSAFSQYLSPAVIEELVNNPDKLTLGGERREISIFFSDIQGFTSISENLSPQKLTEVLNYYLSEMTAIIMESGGTIDKYEGDAIIAFWNAPLIEEDHAKRVLTAAMKCQERLTELREELEKLSGSKMYQRIGINTGYAVVGNLGSAARFDYTMLGDSVNLASRLEGLNKQFGTYTMCSEATMQAALSYNCDLCFRKLAKVAVVGKKEPVVVYEPMFADDFVIKKELIASFYKGYDLFYSGNFEEALSVFELSEKDDIPAHFYAEKCRLFISNPPSEFNGVWIATEK